MLNNNNKLFKKLNLIHYLNVYPQLNKNLILKTKDYFYVWFQMVKLNIKHFIVNLKWLNFIIQFNLFIWQWEENYLLKLKMN
jgi:hypothetical protein